MLYEDKSEYTIILLYVSEPTMYNIISIIITHHQLKYINKRAG